jgi:hypothetical protein
MCEGTRCARAKGGLLASALARLRLVGEPARHRQHHPRSFGRCVHYEATHLFDRNPVRQSHICFHRAH